MKENINGIIGTIIFHLLALIVFLIFKLDRVKDKHEDQLAIEFSQEEFKTIEQIIQESKPKELNINPLSSHLVKNIEVNTANELREQIDARSIERQIMEDEGIESLEPKEIDAGEPVVANEKDMNKKPKERKEYTGRTITEYSLKNRSAKYIHKPNYLCQYGGTVKMKIVVNQDGNVINASIIQSSSADDCLKEAALSSANRCRFNRDYNSPARQDGTLTYTFISQ